MKELNEEFPSQRKKKPSWFQQFFMLCSGADKQILYACPTEWNKYAGIGATIFLTACLALLSGGYAMHLVFEDKILSVAFGIFWAIVIFNLDRYIVLSLRKERIPTTTDIIKETDALRKRELKSERSRLIWNQVYMASPRFVIALVIAVTVSKPIELRLFDRRISKELAEEVKNQDDKFDQEEAKRIKQLNDQIGDINQKEESDKIAIYSNNPIYQDAKQAIPLIEASIHSKNRAISENQKIVDANKYKVTRYRNDTDPVTFEQMRIPYSVWLPNAKARSKIAENKGLTAELRKLNVELEEEKGKQRGVESKLGQQADSVSARYAKAKTNLTTQITQLNRTYEKRKGEWMLANKQSSDLPARLEALGNISSKVSSIWWASFVITILFIVIETAPVIVKLLTKRGPYDEILDRLEYEHYLNEQEVISRNNLKINELLDRAREAAKLEGDIFVKVEKQRLEQELTTNKAILEDLANKQEHLAQIAIEEWYQDELRKGSASVAIAQSKSSPQLHDVFWRQKSSGDRVEFFFRNGTENEVIHLQNGNVATGKWSYGRNDEIVIEMYNSKSVYAIAELDLKSLKLRQQSNGDLLEFEKV